MSDEKVKDQIEVLPTNEDIEAFRKAWQEQHHAGARSGRDRYGIEAVLKLRGLEPEQFDARDFSDGSGTFCEEDEHWMHGGLRVLLTRRAQREVRRAAGASASHSDRLESARNVAAFLRGQDPDAPAMGLSKGERTVIVTLDDEVTRQSEILRSVQFAVDSAGEDYVPISLVRSALAGQVIIQEATL